ncbi:MAG: flagellar assembly protein FliX [Rhodospirillaceae bacterium]|nr:flagellar assembly protein FliX [Rhodospirillaceae bacterium]
MKVGATGSTSASGRTRKGDARRKVDGVGFADILDQTIGSIDDSAAVDGTVSLSGVEAILAAQEVDPDGGERARVRFAQRGEDVLDLLEGVRLGLLSGAVPKDDLADLARLVRSKREAGIDPRLSAILDEIELRAEIEIAKLTRGL